MGDDDHFLEIMVVENDFDGRQYDLMIGRREGDPEADWKDLKDNNTDRGINIGELAQEVAIRPKPNLRKRMRMPDW